MFKFILCLCVALLQLVSEVMLSDPIYEGETWVEKDSSLRIVCKIPMQEPYALHWTINNEPLDSSLVKNLDLIFCRVDGDESTQFKLGQNELILNCSIADEVHWYRNGTKMAKKDNIEFIHANGTNLLKITKPKVADIGDYTCQGANEDARKASVDIRVSMEPIVAELATSFNVVEGEKLRVPCAVYGYPTPKIEWRRENSSEGKYLTVKSDDRIMFEDNEEGITNGTLVITEVKMEDRDNYMCFAFNDLGDHNSTTLIRVIDKYAALWPFLGICIEVIVLCAVIFVCERRRNKKQFEESDNEQNNTKHVGNAKDSEVRNRK